MAPSFFDDVVEFHRLFRTPPSRPIYHLDGETYSRRMRLITEELAELARAHSFHDVTGFADGLVDLTWVVLGTAVESGFPFNELWEEVRIANMAKVPINLDATGKLIKPPGWKPPDIRRILLEALDR